MSHETQEMGSSGGGAKNNKAHLLAIPISAYGHVIPMLTFVTHLARKGVTVTMLLYEDLQARLTAKGLLSELQGLDFRMVGLHNPWGETRQTPMEISRNIHESVMPVVEKLLRDKSSGIAGPTSLITDMLFTWPLDLSKALGIPWYMFIPSGAILAKAKQGTLWLFETNQLQIGPDKRLVKFDGTVDIPGLPPLHYHELISTIIMFPSMWLNRAELMCQAAGVVVNSVYELEEQVIKSMIAPDHPELEKNKVEKIYPVGPLLSTSGNLRSSTVGSGLDDSADESILWLNKQPPSSVLYVAFGTIAQLKPGEIHELALGLEASNQRFLWVLPQRKLTPQKETSSVMDGLPPSFQARVGDRGLIVTGWAPQLQILAHSATGGFLTHTGWNSSLESITNGIPMVCWPQWAEQHLNCRYLVDVLKVADQLQTGAANILDRKEVERAVRVVMVEPEGKEMRRRVEELKRKVTGAVAEGGSTSSAIEEFVVDISNPQYPKNV